MYPNDLSRDLVEIYRHHLLSAADAHRRTRLVAEGDGWSIVIVRRAVGSQLIRLGNAVTGDVVPRLEPLAVAVSEPA